MARSQEAAKVELPAASIVARMVQLERAPFYRDSAPRVASNGPKGISAGTDPAFPGVEPRQVLQKASRFLVQAYLTMFGASRAKLSTKQ